MAKKINSIHNNKTKKFLLFQITPTKPIKNKIKEKFNNIIKGINLTFTRVKM
jgi:hypothetical protein